MLKYIFFTVLTLLTYEKANALEFDTFSLDNGLTVYVIEDHRAPVALNFVWYPIGAGDEVEGKTGIAHMLEHLMFKGTKNIPPQEFSKIVARYGGQDNAFTSYDYTAYYQKVGVDNVEKMMEIEADRMRGLTFTDTEFLPERDVVMEERRLRTDSKPMARFYEKLMHLHMPHHPYGRPIIGWMKDIQGYTSEMAHDWYKQWYQPSYATLIVAGDVTLKQVKEWVSKTYAQVPNTKEITRPTWSVEPLFEKPKRVEHIDAEIKVPAFVRLYRTPSYFEGIAGEAVSQKDILPLSLLSYVLGSGSTSKLYKTLVKEQKKAVSVSTHYASISRGESSFDFYLTPAEGISLSEAEKALDIELQRILAEKDISEEDLERAKTQFLAADVYGRDDLFVTTYHFGRWLSSGGKAEHFDDWMEEIKEVSVEDLFRVAHTYFNDQQSTTAYAAASKDVF